MAKTPKLQSVSESSRNSVTSYDVAKLAGVSQSAVSRCFRDGGSISSKMRKRVLDAAQQLGYEPNAIARSLTTRRSNIVAVLISNLTNLNCPEVLAEITRNLRDNGMRVLLFALTDDSEVDEALENIWPYRVDGVISAADLSPAQANEIVKRHIPAVSYNRTIPSVTISTVCCDQEEGARQLVESLHEAGHRSFAYISGPAGSDVSVERETATLERLEELGVEDVTTVVGDYSYESGFRCVLELFASEEGRPDALICANDVMAIGAIDALRSKLNLRIPDDVSVVGFDGIAPAAWKGYEITTIRQPVSKMARAAVTMLIEQIEAENAPIEKRVYCGSLRQGSSSRL